MTKLYEISNEYTSVIEAIEQLFEAHPDLDEASKRAIIEENLAGVQQSFDDKAFALGGLIQNLKFEHSNVKELQDRFTKRAKGLEKTISQLSDYLLAQMQAVNRPKLANAWLTLQIRTNPCRVIIEDETLLGEEFKLRETIIKINKTAIGEQLKAGKEVPYAHLEQSQRLEIK
jgi:Siphovirus Gp157